jgi:hypothetical protein
MDEAIADLNSSASPCVAQVAREYGVSRSTLSRRWRGVTTSKAQSVEDHKLLNDNQEQELKNYIERLCERCLPPTPAIVSQMAAKLAGKQPGSNWCSRFVERHKAELDSRYLNSLDLQRHHADSVASYKQYFDTVRSKMREYDIRAEDCYNMDEKGFLIGRTHKAKRVFNKDLKASGRLLGAGQDGAREWITVVGCICADGTTLPPLVIYKSKASTVQDSWLEDFDAEKHDCWFTSSRNGWTTDEIGLKWLDQLFHQRTKDKSRRRWRLLFVDGHGSHVTLPFLEHAHKHRILVAVYPPHATHRLQPLDVGCFAPLATYYSQNLERFTVNSEGFTRLQKRDFFHLFFPAWQKAFTEKNVASSWRGVGLFPLDPDVVLGQLRGAKQASLRQPVANRRPSSSPPICFDSPSVNRRLRKMTSRTADKKTKKWMTQLTEEVLSTKAKLTLARIEKRRAIGALHHEKKRRKKGMKLMEEFKAQEGTSAVLFSPGKVRKAIELKECREQAVLEEEREKQLRIQEKAALKAHKEQEAQRKRFDRAMAAQAKQEAKDRKQADKVKAKEAKEAQATLQKQLKASANASRRDSNKQREAPVVAVNDTELEAGEVPEQARSRSGRSINRPARFRR